MTEVNAGRKTAGVDGRVVLTGWEKAELVAWLQHGTPAWKPRPVKRVFIPKSGGKRRGLGIPVIADTALQALTVAALEPEWETRFESRSYGFRPGRSCQNAMQAVFVTVRGKTCKRLWALDADLAAAFDRIEHSHLLDQLGSFPARERIQQWLTAGVLDRGRFAPTEQAAHKPRGLAFNEDKTRIVHLTDDGVDLLGFNARGYRGKLLRRQLTLRPRQLHQALAHARAELATTRWREKYAIRAGAESTVHQAISTCGIRRARYRGLPQVSLQHAFTAIAINLIRLHTWWNSPPPDHARTSHLTRLDHALAA